MRHYLIGGLWLTLCLSAFQGLYAADPPAAEKGIGKFEITPAGVGIYRPEKWGCVQVNLRNPQSKAVHVLASTHFLGDTTFQFGRRLWMPPQSVIHALHPIKMPPLKTADQRFFELRTLLATIEGGVETLNKNELGAMQFDQAFQVADAKQVTAVVFPFKMLDSLKSLWANQRDILLTARYELSMTSNIFTLLDNTLPPNEEAWDAVDHLVIGDDRIRYDSSGIKAIRRWVTGGGSMWIMADHVSPELLEELLGDEAAVTVVDRVDLTHVSLVKANGTDAAPMFERDLDRPTPLVRVIAENVEPAFYVNGWPAAFWKSYGEGRVLVTTMGSDGWLRPRKPEDPTSNAGISHQTVFYGSEPLNHLAGDFFVPRAQAAFQPAVAEEQVRQTIGYSIPTRGVILGTLLGFTAVMAISAAWLSRSGRLEWLGVATPIAALLSAGVLMASGNNARLKVSNTTSVMQLVQAVPGTNDVRVTGVAGIFSVAGESKDSLAGDSGGWMMPEMAGNEGVTRRLIWTDSDRWSWQNMIKKSGLTTAHTQVSGPATRPISAEARIETSGLSGRLILPEGLKASDAILATSTGRIGLNVTNEGQWTAGADSELLPSQYVAGSVLSDEQQRRARILSDLLKPQPNKPVPAVPMLYAWTTPWEMGLHYSQDSPVSGSSLVAIPVTWAPAAAGEDCPLPRPLLTYSEVTGPDGVRPSQYYDFRSNEWNKRSGETTSWVAFDLPRGIMPVTTKNVELTFKLTGAMGRLEISGFKDGKVQSIKVWDDPVGTLTHTVEDGTLLPLDSHGRFVFRIDAGTSNASAFKNPTNAGEASPAPSETASSSDVEPVVAPINTSSTGLTNYFQFEEISARITVTTPVEEAAAPAAP